MLARRFGSGPTRLSKKALGLQVSRTLPPPRHPTGCGMSELGSSDEAGNTGVTRSGECRHCGSSLLCRENHSEVECGSPEAPHPAELVARRFADLIADMPSLGKEACRPDTEKALTAIRARTGLVRRQDLAAKAGVLLGRIESPAVARIAPQTFKRSHVWRRRRTCRSSNFCDWGRAGGRRFVLTPRTRGLIGRGLRDAVWPP